MINIIDKSKCCGCSACSQACPKHCITMREDEEGFLYPHVDTSLCIDCGLCERVCPELNPLEKESTVEVIAAKHTDDNVRLKSSSGGIFTLIADRIIEEGGVVFGARFDKDWEVCHDIAENKEQLEALRGSKYVQSRMGDTFARVKEYLDKGVKVLFTGTSCQVAGLKHYLRKDYQNLFAVDVVCHGAPSPKVWRKYLDEVTDRIEVKNIEFRNKIKGWKNYSFILCNRGKKNSEKTVVSDIFRDNIFMKAFLSNMILRPSCYECPFKAFNSGSDLTLGDFWGVEEIIPEFDDDKGCSLLLVYQPKVKEYLTDEIVTVNVDLQDALKKNSSIMHQVKVPLNRKFFFHTLNTTHKFHAAYNRTDSMSMPLRLRRIIYRKLGI